MHLLLMLRGGPRVTCACRLHKSLFAFPVPRRDLLGDCRTSGKLGMPHEVRIPSALLAAAGAWASFLKYLPNTLRSVFGW